MNELISELISLIKNRWPRRSTLLLLILLALLVLFSAFSIINFQNITCLHLIIIVVVILIIIIVWLISNRFPKTPKGKIGFGLAIQFETKEQNDKIVKDFIVTLRGLMQRSKFKYPYHFIVYSPYLAGKVETLDDAQKYLNSSRLNYLIWGRVRTRLINGKESNILDLQGMVRHKQVNPATQKHLATEFNEVFPGRVIIASENDIFSFEITADLMHLVATYIIGLAALISGDFSFAQELFEYLSGVIKSVKTDLPAIIKIRQRLPSRLSDLYSVQSNLLIFQWEKTKDSNLLIQAKSFLDKLKLIDPARYDAHIKRAIVIFVIDRDIAGAKIELEKCRTNHLDITWRYNYAFLLAYEGDLSKAYLEYKRAFKGVVSSNTLKEIESFILWVLDKEPEKFQLNFLLGLLYLRKIDNPSQAIKAFEKFLANTPNDMFVEFQKFAREKINELRKIS